MEMIKSKVQVSGIAILAIIFFTLFIVFGRSDIAVAGIGDALIFDRADVTTSKLVTTSSTLVLATSTSRQYAIIVNDSGYPIYLQLKAGLPAVAYEGIKLASSSSYVINSDNLYTGAITAISVGGSASTTVTAVQK